MVRRVARRLARILVGLVVVILVIVGLAISVLETGWAKNRIRELVVHQANEYLNATLTIGRLGGSLLRGLELGDIRLSRDGHALVEIDEIALSYSLRELVQSGTVIRRIRLTHPQFFLARQPDNRWDLAAIVKRERQEGPRSGPGRPIEIQSIEIIDGRVKLANPLDFGAAHAPTDFESLNAKFSFAYYPVRWRLDFDRVSWIGHEPDLTMTRLSGALGNGPGGWFFDKLSIETPRSAFTVGGRVVKAERPTQLNLIVHAPRFAFQEWSGVIRGLKNIAIESSFDAALKGPVSRLVTDLRLTGTGGSVGGHLTLDTTVPGWHGTGAVDVGRLNLARWLNNAQRPSDITGHVTFDLALELGRHFPRGAYTFNGPHAMYMDYAADNVVARGQITAHDVLVQRATASAYGARVATHDGSIGVDSPFPFRFQGTVNQIDLRHVPATVPVPRVESLLTFDYDVKGQFSKPYIAGHAVFAPSTFLGADLGAGMVGAIDTQQTPIEYSGEGDIANVDLHRFGEGLDVAWLQDPRYDGTIAGRFRVNGSGTDRATMALSASGRLAHSELFHGTLDNADVEMTIDRGTLRASYSGAFARVDPAIPFADPRWQASLTGSGTMSATVQELLTRDVTLADYDVAGAMTLGASSVRGIPFDRGRVNATLRDSTLTVTDLQAAGPAIEGTGSGVVALDETQTSTFAYDLTRADFASLRSLTGRDARGLLATKGRLSGPWNALHLVGDGSIGEFEGFGVTALAMSATYDVTLPATDPVNTVAKVDGRATFLTIAGQAIQDTSGTITLAPAGGSQRLGFDLRVAQAEQRGGTIGGVLMLRLGDRAIDVAQLAVAFGAAPWRLRREAAAPTIRWTDAAVSIAPIVLVGGNGDERFTVEGDWRTDGNGTLHVRANHVFLDTLRTAFERPARYGGVLDLDATIRGTRDRPLMAATVNVSNGRVERINYQLLSGRVNLADGMFTIDLRLDQAPGVWLTANGTVPTALFRRDEAPRPIDVALHSSGINLGLLEGLTNVIRNVSGELRLDVRAVGTSRDPHFTGAVAIDRAAFDVAATGAKYRNARLAVTLSPDRIAVDAFHLEDANGRLLELHGSLGTHELRVGDLEIEIGAKRFQVLRNDFGRMEIDAQLQLRGRFEAPRLLGELTISSGELKVDELLQRAVFRPYSTEETVIGEVDAVAALNPWERLGLDLTLHVPNTLRLVGENVQVSPGTPIGLGDINLRVAGDVYLYKDPSQPMYVNGSFDTVTGTYAFQGRRFDVDPASSIIFHGDLNPDLYVGVTRTISGVQTRVGLIGPLRQPELRMSSIPPLDETDILSLIVFNTSANDLTALQQQELVARAGALAAGFLATPLISALSSEIGLDVLEIEPGGENYGDVAKLTVGQEIAPGLVARFSRQFGPEPYDEAAIEYYLSKILRLRATFSDAQTLTSRSPFRRVERAGIDLLLFFSF